MGARAGRAPSLLRKAGNDERDDANADGEDQEGNSKSN